MYCSNCGTQLPDEASFCWKCGKPQKPGVQVDEPKWETCEIVYSLIKKGSVLSNVKMQFWADAIGLKGNYNAGDSPIFEQYVWPPAADDKRANNAHKSLIQQLVTAGWESTGNRGSDWWSHRFKRRKK